MYAIKDQLSASLREIDDAGLTKRERELTTRSPPTSPPRPARH